MRKVNKYHLYFIIHIPLKNNQYLWYNYIRKILGLFLIAVVVINIVKKIYIITGANGFLGNNIIRKLEQDADNEIRAFVLKGDSIKSLEKLKCKIYYGDVTKKKHFIINFWKYWKSRSFCNSLCRSSIYKIKIQSICL